MLHAQVVNRGIQDPNTLSKALHNNEAAISQEPDLSFLEQAEDIEREAWWIVSNERLSVASSPFRVFRAAFAAAQNKQNSKIKVNFCKSFLVLPQAPNEWRIESSCKKPSVEIGVVQRLPTQKGPGIQFNQTSEMNTSWKMTWKTQAFSAHFGLSTAILYTQQSCLIDLNSKGRITAMACPQYVRDLRDNEIAVFNIFEYSAKGPQILKIQGEVKKDLQIISTFKSEVPLAGDIVIKIKKIPQKKVEDKTDFSNMGHPDPTRGESRGQKENAQTNEKDRSKSNEKKDEESGHKNNEENGSQNSGEKDRQEKGSKKIDPENGDPNGDPANDGYPGAPAIESPPSESIPPIAPSR